MTVTLVIPIKQLVNAKQRLSGLMSAPLRQAFFKAMVEDVLEAATTSDRIDEVLVITSDESVADLARAYSARVLPEPRQPGLIEAVTHAAEVLTSEGVDVMVFLPGDVPLVTTEELAVAVEGIGQSDSPECLIVPAADLGGSNCMVCSPPNAVTFGFGEDSFRRHLRLAREAGVEPMVARLPGIGLDVDTPEDVAQLAREFERAPIASHTYRFMRDFWQAIAPDDLPVETNTKVTL